MDSTIGDQAPETNLATLQNLPKQPSQPELANQPTESINKPTSKQLRHKLYILSLMAIAASITFILNGNDFNSYESSCVFYGLIPGLFGISLIISNFVCCFKLKKFFSFISLFFMILFSALSPIHHHEPSVISEIIVIGTLLIIDYYIYTLINQLQEMWEETQNEPNTELTNITEKIKEFSGKVKNYVGSKISGMQSSRNSNDNTNTANLPIPTQYSQMYVPPCECCLVHGACVNVGNTTENSIGNSTGNTTRNQLIYNAQVI